MQGLTQRQHQTLEFIRKSIEERGYPPTLREIGEHFGIQSTNGVNDHLKALEKKGFLAREGLKSRAMRPTGPSGSGTGSNKVVTPGSLGIRLGEALSATTRHLRTLEEREREEHLRLKHVQHGKARHAGR